MSPVPCRPPASPSHRSCASTWLGRRARRAWSRWCSRQTWEGCCQVLTDERGHRFQGRWGGGARGSAAGCCLPVWCACFSLACLLPDSSARRPCPPPCCRAQHAGAAGRAPLLCGHAGGAGAGGHIRWETQGHQLQQYRKAESVRRGNRQLEPVVASGVRVHAVPVAQPGAAYPTPPPPPHPPTTHPANKLKKNNEKKIWSVVAFI